MRIRLLVAAGMAAALLTGAAGCGAAATTASSGPPTTVAARASAPAMPVSTTAAAAAAAAAAGSLAPSTPAPSTPAPSTPAPAAPAPAPAPKVSVPSGQLLATLAVKGRAPQTGYSRDQFGPAWADVDHNGCDTRNDILNRDLTTKAWRAGTHDCVVIAGALADPYTGRLITFSKGDATAVQIDHVVALSDAWQTGAQSWTADQRERYANDPLNLLAVDGPTNEAKGDSDAASWLPPNKSFRCAYVTRQVDVKAKYGLWVTSAEHDAVAAVLATCSGAAPPALAAAPPAAAPPALAAAPPAPAPPATAAPTPAVAPAAGSVYYANCAAARAAGAAPLHVGQPGYRIGLDRDHDGVACES